MTEVPMARRAGKAASRKARQRKVHRPIGATPAAPVSAPPPDVDAATPPSPAAAAPAAPRRAAVAGSASASRLSGSERSEYHYVERDLRDIAILTAVMAALLFVAWLAFSATGLIGA
jgi:hypothetical protein